MKEESIGPDIPKTIYCFKHCDDKKNVFSFEPTIVCPICNKLSDTYLVAPFGIPSPFSDAKDSPCSLVMRPGKGDFLNQPNIHPAPSDYRNSVGLHIGLTDLNGIVYEFDHNGLSNGSNSHEWNQCLTVDIITMACQEQGNDGRNCNTSLSNSMRPETIFAKWHNVLTSACLLSKVRVVPYDKDCYNCYNFVLNFLKLLNIPRLDVSLKDKTKFCQEFLVSKTRLAAKYISLYRKLKNNNVIFCEISGGLTVD